MLETLFDKVAYLEAWSFIKKSYQHWRFPVNFAKVLKISDFHKMFVTVIKTHYKKQKAKTIQYRNYKHFHEQS